MRRAAPLPDLPAPAVAGALLGWFRGAARDLPWRRRRTPYRVWVAEIMLQQTTVKAVVPYYLRFVARFPTLRRLAEARPQAVLAAWSGLGYYRRARHLHQAARLVASRHGGRLPRGREALLALPGIGRYTAGAILSIAHRLPEPVLDGNVERVLCRLHGVRGDPRRPAVRRRLWDAARALVLAAPEAPGDLNEALMELGAMLCTPAAPRCGECPVARACAARAGGFQERTPPAARRAPAVALRARLAYVERGGRVLLRRRGATSLMEGLFELPAFGWSRAGGFRILPAGPPIEPGAPIGTLRHSVTFRRIRATVHRARLLGRPRDRALRFVPLRAARRAPIGSLTRRALALAGAAADGGAAGAAAGAPRGAAGGGARARAISGPDGSASSRAARPARTSSRAPRRSAPASSPRRSAAS